MVIGVGGQVLPAFYLGEAVRVEALGALDRLNFLEDVSILRIYGIAEGNPVEFAHVGSPYFLHLFHAAAFVLVGRGRLVLEGGEERLIF